MLYRALAKETETLMISFSRQYPRWLFPGKDDKDRSKGDLREEGVEYLIDSINPLSWSKALKRAKEFGPSIAIFPWWHVYWAPCFWWFSQRLKSQDVEIVFLCHNVFGHEDAPWKRRLGDLVLRSADRFVVHTVVDERNLRHRFPQRSVTIHPIPVFEEFPEATTRLPRRAKLELLFFGFIRPYKGLEVLLEAINLLKDEDIFLSVVGEFWKGEEDARQFIVDNKIENKVEFEPRYVSDGEAASYFERCDLVVLPYRSATGSAVIPLAYRYGKPVIATRVGGLPDVVEDGVSGTLIDPDSGAMLAEAIRKVLSSECIYSPDAIASYRRRLSWWGLVKSILDAKP